MASTTSKRGLNKPARTDYVNVITDLNDNMDNLDNAVPDSRTVNGHALSSDVTVTKADLGLDNVDNVKQVPVTRTVNGHALSSDVTVSKGDVGLGNVDNVQQVPATRKVNNKALSSDVTLYGSDIPMNSLDGTKLDDAINDTKSAITEQTRNLIIGKIVSAYINGSGEVATDVTRDIFYAKVENGKSYYITTNDTAGLVCAFFETIPAIGSISYNSQRIVQESKIIVAPIDGYIGFRTLAGYKYAQVDEGTVATNYIRPLTAVDANAREYINDINSEIERIENEYELKQYINAFDKYTSGKYIDQNGHIANGDSNYVISELTEVNTGEHWLYHGKNTAGGLSFVWGYSDKLYSNPIPLVQAQTIDGYYAFIIPSGVKYILAFTNINSGKPFFMEHEQNARYYGLNNGSFRTFLNTYCMDGTKGNKIKIFMLPGTYDFDDEFTEEEKSSSSFIGVQIPQYASLIGYEGKFDTVLSCSVSSDSISTLNFSNHNHIQGLTIKGENCRYAIHDDFSETGNRISMKDCDVIADRCSYGWAYGGGCRSDGYFIYEDCRFSSVNYDGGAYEMHSNTGFTKPTTLKFVNCIFEMQNGTPSQNHYERAFELRALGNTSIVNTCILLNCKSDGYNLRVGDNNFVDWKVLGSGNNQDVYVGSTNNDFYLDFYDKPATDTLVENLGAENPGVFRLKSGIPQWWDGEKWIDGSTGATINNLNNGENNHVNRFATNSSNAPSTDEGDVFTASGGVDNKFQIAVTKGQKIFYRRMWGTWGSWNDLSIDLTGSTISDYNNAENNKVNRVSSNASNAPSTKEANVVTFAGGSDNKIQLSVDRDNRLYSRIMWGVNNWSDWKPYKETYDTTYPFDVSPANLSTIPIIGVLGDSYASGEIRMDDAWHDIYYQSWGQIIARTKGITVHNFSEGGQTAKGFLGHDAYGIDLLLSTEKCNLYVIVFSINETKTEEAIGTISDIGTNADTFYRYYSEIITKILEYNTHAKIIAVKGLNNTNEGHIRLNTAIQNIADYFDIPTIAQYAEPFFQSSYFNNTMRNGHPNPSSYGGMANVFTKMIENCMAENWEYFYDVNYYDLSD